MQGCHTSGGKFETAFMPGPGPDAPQGASTPYPLAYSSHTTAANPTPVITTKYGRAIHTIRP